MNRRFVLLGAATALAALVIVPGVARAVLYTWKPAVESGNWRAANWDYTCPPSSTCNTYPDDDNDDALIVVGQDDNYQRTVAINDDCIDDFTYDGDDDAEFTELTLLLESDGSGPKTVVCTTVTIDGFGVDPSQTTILESSDGTELTTVGSCE